MDIMYNWGTHLGFDLRLVNGVVCCRQFCEVGLDVWLFQNLGGEGVWMGCRACRMSGFFRNSSNWCRMGLLNWIGEDTEYKEIEMNLC